jgi:hypothetical protein
VKTIQRQRGQASHETHADGELRDSHRKKVRRDPNMNSGGSAPADVGGEPPNGRAKGATSIESKSNVSRPPEETQHPSVLAHANDPAKSRIRDRDPLTLSPPRGNHPRSSACAPKDNREGRHRQPATETRKRGHSERRVPMSAALRPAREKMSAHDAEPRCLGLKPRLCGWEKK